MLFLQKFQPPSIQDPAILSFHQSPNITTTPPTTTTSTISSVREKGFIDKRQVSFKSDCLFSLLFLLLQEKGFK